MQDSTDLHRRYIPILLFYKLVQGKDLLQTQTYGNIVPKVK